MFVHVRLPRFGAGHGAGRTRLSRPTDSLDGDDHTGSSASRPSFQGSPQPPTDPCQPASTTSPPCVSACGVTSMPNPASAATARNAFLIEDTGLPSPSTADVCQP